MPKAAVPLAQRFAFFPGRQAHRIADPSTRCRLGSEYGEYGLDAFGKPPCRDHIMTCDKSNSKNSSGFPAQKMESYTIYMFDERPALIHLPTVNLSTSMKSAVTEGVSLRLSSRNSIFGSRGS